MGIVNITSQLSWSGSYSKTQDHTTPRETVSIFVPPIGQLYLNGTGSEQGNLYFGDRRQLVATSETIDLTSTLLDAFGATIALVKLKELIIYNTEATTAKNLTISGNALLAFGTLTSFTLGPGGTFHVSSPVDGFSIANAITDQLTLNSGANTVTYDIFLIGNT